MYNDNLPAGANQADNAPWIEQPSEKIADIAKNFIADYLIDILEESGAIEGVIKQAILEGIDLTPNSTDEDIDWANDILFDDLFRDTIHTMQKQLRL